MASKPTVALTPDGFSAAVSLCREGDACIQVLDALECEVERGASRYGVQRCGSRGIDKRLATLAVWLHFEAHLAERAAWQYCFAGFDEDEERRVASSC